MSLNAFRSSWVVLRPRLSPRPEMGARSLSVLAFGRIPVPGRRLLPPVHTTVRHKSKPSKSSKAPKPSKKAPESETDETEKYNLKEYESAIETAIDKFRVQLRPFAAMVDRPSATLLDGLRVHYGGERLGLYDVCNVTVEGRDLKVAVYDAEYTAPLMEALQASKLNFSPVQTAETQITVRIPKPDIGKRTELQKQAAKVGENARSAISSLRTQVLRNIKTDFTNGLITKNVVKQEEKEVDDATKKATGEIDATLKQLKKVLMDEK